MPRVYAFGWILPLLVDAAASEMPDDLKCQDLATRCTVPSGTTEFSGEVYARRWNLNPAWGSDNPACSCQGFQHRVYVASL